MSTDAIEMNSEPTQEPASDNYTDNVHGYLWIKILLVETWNILVAYLMLIIH